MNNTTEDNVRINLPNMCDKHKSLLIHQANYLQTDPWQSLILATQITLFQAITADGKTYAKLGDDITKIETLGCLACYKPDVFGEIVEAAKSKDLEKIFEIGKGYINDGLRYD